MLTFIRHCLNRNKNTVLVDVSVFIIDTIDIIFIYRCQYFFHVNIQFLIIEISWQRCINILGTTQP